MNNVTPRHYPETFRHEGPDALRDITFDWDRTFRYNNGVIAP
jgi:hypothetical protein